MAQIYPFEFQLIDDTGHVFSILDNGQVIKDLIPKVAYFIHVLAPTNFWYKACFVRYDGDKKHIAKELESIRVNNQNFWQYRIEIMKNKKEKYISWPMNHMRLFCLNGTTGLFQLWEISLVSQDGNFYLCCQQGRGGQCYQNDGRLICPEYENWGSMHHLMFRWHETTEFLKPIAQYTTPKPPAALNGLPDNHARIEWYNLARGMGVITTTKGAAYVHHTEIVHSGSPCLRELPNQGVVSFKELRSPKSKRTSIPLEAVGVKLLT